MKYVIEMEPHFSINATIIYHFLLIMKTFFEASVNNKTKKIFSLTWNGCCFCLDAKSWSNMWLCFSFPLSYAVHFFFLQKIDQNCLVNYNLYK